MINMFGCHLETKTYIFTEDYAVVSDGTQWRSTQFIIIFFGFKVMLKELYSTKL